MIKLRNRDGLQNLHTQSTISPVLELGCLRTEEGFSLCTTDYIIEGWYTSTSKIMVLRVIRCIIFWGSHLSWWNMSCDCTTHVKCICEMLITNFYKMKTRSYRSYTIVNRFSMEGYNMIWYNMIWFTRSFKWNCRRYMLIKFRYI